MKTIKNVRDLADFIGSDCTDEASLSRRVYKDTACGAWLALSSIALTPVPELWIFELRPSIVGVIVAKARRKGKRALADLRDLPPHVLEYLCLKQDSRRPVVEGMTAIELQKLEAKADLRGWRDCYGANILRVTPRGSARIVTAVIPRPRHAPGIVLGSIVEGTDAEARCVELVFPFSEAAFDDAIKGIEDEVESIWNETHGCDQCIAHWQSEGVTEYEGDILEYGKAPVWDECPECGGNGIPV